jgi:hypothetical protein
VIAPVSMSIKSSMLQPSNDPPTVLRHIATR